MLQSMPGTVLPEKSIKIDEAILKNVSTIIYFGGSLTLSCNIDMDTSNRRRKAVDSVDRLRTRIYKKSDNYEDLDM